VNFGVSSGGTTEFVALDQLKSSIMGKKLKKSYPSKAHKASPATIYSDSIISGLFTSVPISVCNYAIVPFP